jgi:glycosyltransferase involved in cell wall biosynthesis
MRIQFFALRMNLTSGGGSHHTLDQKIRYLMKRGHEVSLTTFYGKENAFQDEVPYRIIEKNFIGGFFELNKFIEKTLAENESNADIFHLDNPTFLWGGGLYRKNGGKVPTVVFVNNYTAGMNLTHSDVQNLPIGEKICALAKSVRYAGKRYLWEKFIGLRYASALDAIIVDSPVVGDIYKKYGFDERRIIIQPELIDVQSLAESTSRLPSLEKMPGYIYLLYVGRLNYDKGADILLKAIAPIAASRKIRLTLVGQGQQKEYLVKLAHKLKLERSVSFEDWKKQDALGTYYGQADIFIHPCRWPEPFGRTIVEAMAFGKPVITSTGSGSAWVMGKGGIAFKNGSCLDLRKKIETLIDDKNLRGKLGGEARKRAQEFDIRKTAPEFENLLIDIVTKNSK